MTNEHAFENRQGMRAKAKAIPNIKESKYPKQSGLEKKSVSICCPSGVCINAQISAIIKARDTKFGMEVPIYHK